MQLNRTRSINWIFLSAVISILVLNACKKGNKLDQTIQTELDKGVRQDSLFLGLKFGIDMKEFYSHCRELNVQGIVKEGPTNMSVEYLFKDSLNNPIAFNFYAHRNVDRNGLIRQYDTSFYYYAWALNRHLYSDVLIKMLRPILMEWYGGNEPFVQIKDGKKHIYKIDGNRMIDLFIFDESTVLATYTDLSYYGNPEIKK
jgi:hypothetical protein